MREPFPVHQFSRAHGRSPCAEQSTKIVAHSFPGDCRHNGGKPYRFAMTDAPQALAEACAAAMWARDKASAGLGMAIERVAPGEAVLTMTVRPDMVNGHDMCHGGFIFTLADSAFAFACNSYNVTTVAASCDIAFLKPARAGETLRATAREVYRETRNGIYDIAVTDQVRRGNRPFPRQVPHHRRPGHP
jgi:acyl-CoA thioesterase